jgi:hypothetical protein
MRGRPAGDVNSLLGSLYFISFFNLIITRSRVQFVFRRRRKTTEKEPCEKQ